MWEEGAKVLIPGLIDGDDDRLIGQTGTLFELNMDEYRGKKWYVKMDQHPGFPAQMGCWIIQQRDMVLIESNKSIAFKLLDKEY